MSYKSLAAAMSDVVKTVHEVKGKTYEQWSVYLGRNVVDAKPKRLWASSRQQLETKIKDFYRTIRRGGEMMALLTPSQVADAKAALDEISAAGSRLSLQECARLALANFSRRTENAVTVKECYDRYMDEKDTSALDRKCAADRVGAWVETCGQTPITGITAQSIVAYLNKNFGAGSAVTWNGRFKYINTFLRWCAAKPRSFIAESPLAGVKPKREEWHEPECISVDAARAVMSYAWQNRATHPEYVAYIALSFFCGVRREEILRISSSDDAARINLDTRTIAILKPKGYLKGIKPRAFEIPDTAFAWMNAVDFPAAVRQIKIGTTDRLYAAVRNSGAVIPKNCGRHSFITYHVCAYENLAKTLMIAGTGEGMSEAHYRSLKSRAEGIAYFAITPEAVAAEAERKA